MVLLIKYNGRKFGRNHETRNTISGTYSGRRNHHELQAGEWTSHPGLRPDHSRQLIPMHDAKSCLRLCNLRNSFVNLPRYENFTDEQESIKHRAGITKKVGLDCIGDRSPVVKRKRGDRRCSVTGLATRSDTVIWSFGKAMLGLDQ